jgi:hypothetical protein
MFHPNVLPELCTVDGRRGEVHPAVQMAIDHGATLACRVPADRRAEVSRVTAVTVGRLTVQTESNRGNVIAALTIMFRKHDRPALVQGFTTGESYMLDSPVNLTGFMQWDGLATPKAPRRPDVPAKALSASPEAIPATVAPEDRRTRKASSEALATRIEASRKRAMADDASEDEIHIAVADILRANERPGVYWFHVPNGGHRSPGAAAKFKAMGVKAGVPDLIVIVAGKVHGLELKRSKGGTVSPEQKQAHADLRSAGAVVEVAKGYQQAVEQLRQWGAIPT